MLKKLSVACLVLKKETRSKIAYVLIIGAILLTAFVATHARQATIMGLLAEESTVDAINAMLNDSDYGYVIMTQDERVIEWNPAMERLTGWDRREISLEPDGLMKIMPLEYRAKHKAAVVKAFGNMQAQRVVRVNTFLIHRNGTHIPVQITVRLVQTRHDGVVAVAHFDRSEAVAMITPDVNIVKKAAE